VEKRGQSVSVVPPHTYPGVYIQEIPSGVRTISSVSTSITAFLGRTARGPVNEPITINSYADFERTFGGLWPQSSLGQVVRDFYLNGGSQAVIVRLFNDGSQPSTSSTSSSSKSSKDSPPPPKINAPLMVNTLPLEARDPGSWGNYLRARIDSVPSGIAQNYNLADGDLFTLTLYDKRTGAMEVFRNVSVKPSTQQVDKILAVQSLLARVPANTNLPAATPPAHGNPAKGKTIWDDDTASTGVNPTDFVTDGGSLTSNDFIGDGLQANKQGLYALERIALFNLLCIPPYSVSGDIDADLIAEAAAYCEKRRAMFLIDPPSSWLSKESAKSGIASLGTNSKNAILYFPRFKRPNSLDDSVPSGAVAGIIARTDAQRGVWKSPAGIDATLVGVSQFSVPLTDDEIGELNPLGINCLRTLPAAGPVVWGARTLQGNDSLASEWKYISVRRLTLFIEESLYQGTKWVVFEPNDEPLWAQIRLNIGSFMHDLFRQGAFQGTAPKDAYLVKCDSETTTQSDINNGIVNILVGFAPLKPAEFVILQIQQLAGQIQV
jgi:phage tail sheath protein FI